MPVLPLNTAIGNYRIEDLIGSGGMGDVYRATRLRDGNTFAIKILRQLADFDDTAVTRFRNEAVIQYNLRHPNVASLVEYMEHEGRPCLVMEYVGGPSIRDLVKSNGPLEPKIALRHFIAICGALSFVHAKKIVHRDIKADNIRFNADGELKLLDFGIALSKNTPKMTRDGYIVGTRASLAPEQLKGLKGDARSDVWAMGVLLYEMVTGKLPFVAGTEATLIHKIMQGKHARAGTVQKGIPPLVDDLISRCLAMKLEDRFPDADALLAEARKVLARLESSWGFFWNVRVSKWVYAGVAVLALAGAGYYLFSTVQKIQEPQGMAMFLPKFDAIVEVPAGRAEVLQSGERVGYTPYRVSGRVGETVSLVLRREGFADHPVTLTLGVQKIYSFELPKLPPIAPRP
jgi:eukaryotic-like serine/threonine-protein kinase